MQNKKIAILQSNYIPWKGYFDIINSVDEFIFYDEMQYTNRDWRSRNKIKTPNGVQWLSVPVTTKGHIINKMRIVDAKIVDKKWAMSHWNTIKQFYKNTPYFNQYRNTFEQLYAECANEDYLCNVNYKFIYAICAILGIKTKLSFCQDYGLIDGKTERLVDLVKKANGTEYLSGPAAKDYIDEKLFRDANIKLTWMDYSGYPEYPQLYPPFEHAVSVLDLIFNCGPNAMEYMQRNNHAR